MVVVAVGDVAAVLGFRVWGGGSVSARDRKLNNNNSMMCPSLIALRNAALEPAEGTERPGQ